MAARLLTARSDFQKKRKEKMKKKKKKKRNNFTFSVRSLRNLDVEKAVFKRLV